jgi:NO-binding membrane sensor protein with MHYT domain
MTDELKTSNDHLKAIANAATVTGCGVWALFFLGLLLLVLRLRGNA